MHLSPELKHILDKLSYKQLLIGWRYSDAGNELFQGQSGEYWYKRMKEIKPENHVAISKQVGWKD